MRYDCANCELCCGSFEKYDENGFCRDCQKASPLERAVRHAVATQGDICAFGMTEKDIIERLEAKGFVIVPKVERAA